LKNIPFTLVMLTIVLPIFLARRPRLKKNVRLMYGLMALYVVVWGILCLKVYPRYVFIE